MKPYYEHAGITIYYGDCREVLPQLGPVDAIVTDPPYNVRAEDIDLEGRAPMRRDFGSWDEGWEAHPFCALALSILRAGGSLLAFTSDRLLWEFRSAPGWLPRGTIVWRKTNPAPHPRPAYVSATEWLVWLQKPGAAATWNGGGYTPNVLEHHSCGGRERTSHPTQKPEALLLDLVARHSDPDNLIVDPYAGTGTTGVAAKRLGRRCVLIERDELWCEVAAKRLAQAVLQLEWTPPADVALPLDTDGDAA